MSEENVTSEPQIEVDPGAEQFEQEPALPEGAAGIGGAIADIDPEKLALLEQRLAEFKTSQTRTASGSEAPDSATPPEFDPAKWEVEPELEHFYRRARVEDTDEGPKWIILEHQYMIQTGAWHVENSGQPRRDGAGNILKNKGRVQYHVKGLDHVINDIINGPEGMYSREKGWRLSALLPGAMGQGIAVFERQVKRTLPDPKPIVDPNEVPLEETTDEELARMQAKAQGWSEGEAGAPVETGKSATADEGTSDPAIGVVTEANGASESAPETEAGAGLNEGGN